MPAQDAVVGGRKTANLHTGGTIHDVTDRLHPRPVEASIRAAQALLIPVVGLDLLVPDVSGPDYVIIEANERPGLANHEPLPTAELDAVGRLLALYMQMPPLTPFVDPVLAAST